MTTRIQGSAMAVGLLAAFGTATPAMAADRYEGVYLGVLGGWSNFDTEVDADNTSIDGASAAGPTMGVVLGTSQAQDGAFLGLEVHATYSDAEYERQNGGDRQTLTASTGVGVTARFGGLVEESTLLYGLAGWQQTRVELETVNGGVDSDSTDMAGVRFGGGVEFTNTARNFVRFEYSAVVHKTTELEAGGETFDVAPVAHHFQVGLGYRF
ncbi:outer membrane beta-barrel protein [Aquisalimonas sp.]|uniref:outer membrane protein n=1 Tax=unclassified Aquisalimonas TaxID=2644645 RepID=UPI0025BFD261|nr:outer membrane beta-barrel protein [Aquisalimonas sp.]